MRENEVMEQLAALATEQTRKTYRRHGATGDLFGVLYSDLRKLQTRCGTDQALADALWATGNHDARVLAAMIADPAAMAEPGPAIGSAIEAKIVAAGVRGNGSATGPRAGSGPRAERKIARISAWAAQVDNRPLAAAVSELAAKTPTAVETMTGWIASGEEWLAATGWNVLAILAGRDGGPIEGSIDDATFRRYLQQIERVIHGSPNWVRHAMNSALIAIGLRSPELQAEALAAAQRIGRVVVDHGQTACKTPDAISYIRRAVLRRSENTNAKKTTANEEPQMTENTTQSSTTKRNNTESAPKTSTKRVADAKPAKKATKKAGAKKAGAKKAGAKKAGAKKVAKKAGAKKVAKKAGAKKVAKKAAKKTGAKKVAKKAGAKKAAKKAGAKKAAKKTGAKKAAKKAGAKKAAKKAGKRAAGNGAAPKKATKRAGKGTTRKQTSPTTSAPPANP